MVWVGGLDSWDPPKGIATAGPPEKKNKPPPQNQQLTISWISPARPIIFSTFV